jgi:hypothetical protein
MDGALAKRAAGNGRIPNPPKNVFSPVTRLDRVPSPLQQVAAPGRNAAPPRALRFPPRLRVKSHPSSSSRTRQFITLPVRSPRNLRCLRTLRHGLSLPASYVFSAFSSVSPRLRVKSHPSNSRRASEGSDSNIQNPSPLISQPFTYITPRIPEIAPLSSKPGPHLAVQCPRRFVRPPCHSLLHQPSPPPAAAAR